MDELEAGLDGIGVSSVRIDGSTDQVGNWSVLAGTERIEEARRSCGNAGSGRHCFFKSRHATARYMYDRAWILEADTSRRTRFTVGLMSMSMSI